ncbi:MAG TPA: hypothetical protein VIY07_06830 [Pseudolabrys sp.]
MKKHLLAIAAWLSLFLALFVVSASAGTAKHLTITVPFDFKVEKTTLPAGTYTIYRTATNDAHGFLIRDESGRAEVLFITHSVQTRDVPARGRLEFRRFGDQYFLARFWWDGDNTGRELAYYHVELEIAGGPAEKVAPPEVISIAQ